MLYRDFISPKEVEIGGRKFAISKIPAIEAQSVVYPAVVKAITDGGIVGITTLPPSVVKEILKRTAVKEEGCDWQELDTDTAINSTFPNICEMHILVGHMVKENFGFLVDGGLQSVLEAAGVTEESDL